MKIMESTKNIRMTNYAPCITDVNVPKRIKNFQHIQTFLGTCKKIKIFQRSITTKCRCIYQRRNKVTKNSRKQMKMFYEKNNHPPLNIYLNEGAKEQKKNNIKVWWHGIRVDRKVVLSESIDIDGRTSIEDAKKSASRTIQNSNCKKVRNLMRIGASNSRKWKNILDKFEKLI